MLLQAVQEPDALDVVGKCADAVAAADGGEDALAVVAERGLADVVAQGDGLDEVLVEAAENVPMVRAILETSCTCSTRWVM